MTRFMIKVVSKATEKNQNFKGEIQTYYVTKNSYTSNPEYIKWYAKESGYKTKSNALQGLKKEMKFAEWENDIGFWKTTCELIEVEI